MERRLAAILAADVVGYSRLMGKDEMGTLAALKACEAEMIDPTVGNHNGRIFKRMGDGFLAVFGSAVDAVECALDWQDKLGQRKDQPLRFRIGIDLGEVIAEADDIYGDTVNVAARLESLAQPGCVALSDDTFRQVKDRLDVKVTDLGEQELKNISRPVRVWEWRSDFSVPEPLRKAKLQLPEKPSIVLLAFRNLSGDEQQDFFAEGLRLDIQTALAQLSGVFLIALGTADAFQGATAREAGSNLRVQYALQCSVRTAGNRIAEHLTRAAALPSKQNPAGGPAGLNSAGVVASRSEVADAPGRGLAVAAALELVLDLLPVGRALQPGALDGRDVQEDVLAAVLGLDETKALAGVEPFHSASDHVRVSFSSCRAQNAAAVASRSVQKDRQPQETDSDFHR